MNAPRLPLLVVARRLAARRSQSSAAAVAVAVEIPTRHSMKQAPRVCSDPVELREETKKILEIPVGKLYASRASGVGGLEEAYDTAYDSIQMAEYLQLGHAAQIPGSLYAPEDGTIFAEPSESPLEFMQPLLDRMKQEGDMFMQLRHQKMIAKLVATDDGSSSSSDEEEEEDSSDDEGYLPSSDDDSDSDSSSSDEEDGMSSKISGVDFTKDFAAPGPTSKLYEAVLDAMACTGGATPLEYFQLANLALDANDLDKGSNFYTLPTLVTYNAALRGIASCDHLDDQVRDEALAYAFTLYNHLTHSLHLPRNSMTITSMCQVLDKALPACRVKGNMSVTFWAHATQIGVVNDTVIQAIKQVHEPSNGPEFDVLMDEISGGLPQKYSRFANKYSHSAYY